jgi:single-strand DNA-binding protein
MGHLGNDPDIRYLSSGTAIATISVATTEKWEDKNTGEQKEDTQWHRIEFWDRRAEFVRDYCFKGQAVYVEGKIVTEKWTDKDGNDRWTTKIRATDIKPLQWRDKADRPQEDSHGKARDTGSKRREEPFEDDIPF